MKLKKCAVICCILLILGALIFIHSDAGISGSRKINNTDVNSDDSFQVPMASSGSNIELINSILDEKVSDYNALSYFPQFYEASLQATYYALYILEALGKLQEINHTEVINFIMSHHNTVSDVFMDELAYRYLDTDFSQGYYPLSSMLEVNCYVVLSLDILNSLNLIDTQEMINFIWSCYNPISSGFIGQPFDLGLEDGFKVSTVDNTYHAVITLDLLMNDWLRYGSERDDIIQFVNDLQLPGGTGWDAGGFLNDEDPDLDSLYPLFEPNLLSSYYCVKTLEMFGMVESIRIPDFHQFLGNLYDSNYDYFRISEWDYGVNYTNIVASSLGLELSDLTNYGGIGRNAVLDFIFNHRNSLGNWDQSTTVAHHELIDTFQIIRSLEQSNEISQLPLTERNEIGNATQLYYSDKGYSHLSEDYTSMNLMYSTISSFSLLDRISELNIQQLFTSIKNSYNESAYSWITNSFLGYIQLEPEFIGLRSFQIEYYSSGYKNYIDEISYLKSHEYIYYALDSLEKLFKLDDFATEYNLMALIDDIIATQFLNESYYQNFGAFTPLWPYDAPFGPQAEDLNKRIFFEYSYFAIRSLEILANQLSLDLLDLGFDRIALYNYIDRNIAETSTQQYFDPWYTSNTEIILQNTYYMIYVLKALNMYNKDDEKIKNLVTSSLNYNNIKNVYYSYKISEILDLNLNFDIGLTQALVQSLYSEDIGEFYLSSSKDRIEQEAISWTCEMARNSKIGIEAHYQDDVSLGEHNTMTVSLYNLIIRDFGSYITFKFESNQLGTFTFDKLANNSYMKDIPLPLKPSLYPVIEGYLRAYEGTELKAEHHVSFATTYDLSCSYSVHVGSTTLSIEINASIIIENEHHPLTLGNAYIRIFKENKYQESKSFTHQNDSSHSLFFITFTPEDKKDYFIEIYLDDGFQVNNVGSSFFTKKTSAERHEDEIARAIPLMVVFVAVPGSVIVISSRHLARLHQDQPKKKRKF